VISSRHKRKDRGEKYKVMAAMNTAAVIATSNTGFSSVHCRAPAALMTTSSEPSLRLVNA
jgi:hypothetical protein